MLKNALIGAAIALLGLTNSSLAETYKVPSPGTSATVDAIKSAGELRAGAATLAPWLLQDPKDSSYIGSATVVAKALAEALGVKLVYVDTTWDTLVAGLLSKKYDIAAAGMTETDERKKVIGFVSFDSAGTCYILRKDSKIASFADLNNPSLVFLGYTGLSNDTMFHTAYPDTQMQEINPPPGYAPRADEVLKGRGDIAAFDSPLAFWVAKKWPDARIFPPVDECIRKSDLERPVSIGIRKGDDAFVDLIREIVTKNADLIKEQNLKFSQPEFVQ
jgi:ABC-type amino acid transport substrate-binding protein